MKRYLHSFLITLSIYAFGASLLFYLLFDTKVHVVPKPTKISLKSVKLKSEPSPPQIQPTVEKVEKIDQKSIEKSVVKKEEIKKVPKKQNTKKQDDNKIESPKQEPIENKDLSPQTPTQNSLHVEAEQNSQKTHAIGAVGAILKRHVHYPNRARRMRIEGVVEISFTIQKDGTITNIRTNNAHQLLQHSTIEALKKAQKEFPSFSKSIDITIPIEYKLI